MKYQDSKQLILEYTSDLKTGICFIDALKKQKTIDENLSIFVAIFWHNFAHEICIGKYIFDDMKDYVVKFKNKNQWISYVDYVQKLLKKDKRRGHQIFWKTRHCVEKNIKYGEDVMLAGIHKYIRECKLKNQALDVVFLEMAIQCLNLSVIEGNDDDSIKMYRTLLKLHNLFPKYKSTSLRGNGELFGFIYQFTNMPYIKFDAVYQIEMIEKSF